MARNLSTLSNLTRRAAAVAAIAGAVGLAMLVRPEGASGVATLHVGDLGGAASQKSSWQAKVTITVHDASDQPLSDVTVGGAWGGGAAGTASCKTGRKGTCTVASPAVAAGTTEVTFRMMGATAAGYTYDKNANHDPDGSSDGTTITITK
jgi:serine protease AprX